MNQEKDEDEDEDEHESELSYGWQAWANSVGIEVHYDSYFYIGE